MSEGKRRWLVGYDFSPYAEAAAREAAAELKALGGGELILFHAYEMPYVPVSMEWPAAQSPIKSSIELDQTLERDSKIALEKAARTLEEAYPGVDYRCEVASGFPAEAVLAQAEADDADRIIMGCHGRKGLSHLVLGSVAERVARLAHIPVLVVKKKAD